MIGTLLSLIPSVIGLFNSSKAHDGYTADLEKIRSQQRLSPSALQARQLYAENATRGLAGYESMREEVQNQLPETMNQAKDWLTSGGAVDFLARASAATNRQLRDLSSANAQQKQNNMNMYAQYLGGAMSGQENMLQDRQNQLDIAGAYNSVDKSATANKYMFGMGNALAGIADEDLAKLIAGLSKEGKSLPNPSGLAPSDSYQPSFDDSLPVDTYTTLINSLRNR